MSAARSVITGSRMKSQNTGCWSCGLVTRCSRGVAAERPSSSTQMSSARVILRLRSINSSSAPFRRPTQGAGTYSGSTRKPSAKNFARWASVSTRAGCLSTSSRSMRVSRISDASIIRSTLVRGDEKPAVALTRGNRKHRHRFGEAAYGDSANGDELCVGQRLRGGGGKKQRGAMFLAECLEPCGQIHCIPMHGVALAPAAADIAGDQEPRVDADAHADTL